MKKLLLSILIFSYSIGLKAQSKMDSYQSTYFKKQFDITINKATTDTTKYDYQIYCGSEDKLYDLIFFGMNDKQMMGFINYLNRAKQVYSKWRQIAIANKVTVFDQYLGFPRYNCMIGFYSREWNFKHDAHLDAEARIVDGKMLLIISSGEVESDENEYLINKGLYLIFESPKEIDDFTARVNIKNVEKFFLNKDKTEQLFKN